MKKIDILIMSLKNLFRRKFRTMLTVLGVVIGCISIILMLSLGKAMNVNMENQLAMMGDLTTVSFYNYNDQNVIDDKKLQEFGKMDHVTYVYGNNDNDYTNTFNFGFDKYRTMWSNSVTKMLPEDMEAFGYEVEEGRPFVGDEQNAIILGRGALMYFTKNGKQQDMVSAEDAPEFIFNEETSELTAYVYEFNYQTNKPELMNDKGSKIKKPKEIVLKVVGMMSENSTLGYNFIVTPATYETLAKARTQYLKDMGQWTEENEKASKGKKTYNNIQLKIDDRNNVQSVVDVLNEQGYQVDNDLQYIEEMKKQSKSREMALGLIGIVSFIVAAIGIANTMMMSIYERTKEIGVMKVIGAKLSDIRSMFLTESFLIGLIGGTVGALLSGIISAIMNMNGERIAAMMDLYGTTTVSIITPELYIGAIIFSTFIGLLSGYLPARKAMKLSALSAIKTD